MRRIVALTAVALSAVACDDLDLGAQHQGHSIKGTGPVRKDSRPVSRFDRLTVGGPFEVVLKRGNRAEVLIEAQESLLSHIKTQLRGQELVVSTDSGLNTDKPLRLTITTDRLTHLEVSGATTVRSDRWQVRDFTLEASGACKVTMPLEVDRLTASLSGASQAKLDGRADRVSLELSGASQLHGGALRIGRAKVDVSGASQADLRVSETIEGEASGASNVRYRGSARGTVESSGASSVTRG